MKPAHERNQECLPPKKRDLPPSSSIAGGDGGGGEEANSTPCSDSASRDPPAGGSAPVEWMRVQPGTHYGVESSDGLGMPLDQYGMLYKVALPSSHYPPSSLHPVLSHLSPAYTVPSSLLQHPAISYPPLGYAHLPPSSLQFVSPPYTVPYAVPPGFVHAPGSLIPPQPGVPHLVPYPSVIQGGVVSPPPQTAASIGPVPTALSQDLAAAELHRSGAPICYPPAGPRVAPQGPILACRAASPERGKEVNGGVEAPRGAPDSAYFTRGPCSGQPVSMETERPQDRSARWPEGRMSRGHRDTPDTDLEVQQVVARLASPNQVVSGTQKEASAGPLNLSQGSHREGVLIAGQTTHTAPLSGPAPTPHHTVLLANGQPVLVPLDYQPQHHPGPPSIITAPSPSSASPKAPNPPPAPHPLERPAQSPAPGAVQPALAPPPGPSHFTKGAIIQLATGELKRVEDLQTQDFVRSAEASGGLKIDSSMVVDIRKSQRPGLVALHFSVGEQQSRVAIDVPPEHPFFVFGQGWSSCSPDRTAQLYGLDCHPLQAGDVCVSITLQQHQSKASTKASSAPITAFQPMGPPAPQQPRHPAHFRGERTLRDRGEDQPAQGGGVGHGEAPRPDRPAAELVRARGGGHFQSEGLQRAGSGAPSLSLPSAAAHRRWSAPGFQKYEIKTEEGACSSTSLASAMRPSFIPQEVKLSIEGRSNAGK